MVQLTHVPSSELRRLVGSALALAAALLLVSGILRPATAEPPPAFTGGITDSQGLLDDCRTDVTAAQTRLFNDTDTQLYVVFVNTTDGQEIGDYLNAVSDRNADQISPRDALLVVATGDRQALIGSGNELSDEISATELDAVFNQNVRPALAEDDWCGAAIGAANGLREAISGNVQPEGTGGGGIPTWLIIAGLVIVAVIAFIAWRAFGAQKEYRERSLQEDLGKQASALLIETDDGLRAAEQELGFAEAQFGAAEAEPFRTALNGAREELKAAFAISQQLDDETPETPEQRRQMLQEVIDRTTRAKAAVAEQKERIDRLRDLSKNVDQVLATSGGTVSELEGRVEAARQTLAGLAGSYAPSSLSSVANNADTAAQKITTAKELLAAGTASVQAGKRDDAVVKVRDAETALGEARTLIDAVETTRASLDELSRTVPAEVAAVQQDLAEAQAAIADGKGAEHEAQVKQAAALLVQAQAAASAQPPDIMGASRLTTEANTAVDAALAGIREKAVAQQRAVAAAQTAIAVAGASITQANAVIAGNMAGSEIGRRARTRLAEAQTYLERANALLAQDAAAATQAAQTADALADEALAEAQASIERQMGYQQVPGGMPPGYGAPQSGGGMGGMGTFILGSILGGILSGGGGGGRSYGGGGGWSRRGGGFGGFGSGGFGGGGGGGGGSRGGGLGGGRRSGGGF
jgi:uncharacterized membrane protein YgcG